MDRLEAHIGRMRSQLAMLDQHEVGDGTLEGTTAALRATLEELYVAEEELRLQHEEVLGARTEAETQRLRYEELFQLAPDGYLLTNEVGIVREANRAAAHLLQVDSRFLVGKPLAAFVDPADRADVRTLINGFDVATKVDEWGLNLVPRDGQAISVSLAATAARDVRNRLVGIRWLIRDVSVRKRNERELLALADERQATLDAAPDGICRLDVDG